MSKQKLFIPIFGTLASKLEPLALPMLRIIVGLVFIYHGYGKFFTLISGENIGWLEGMISDGGLPFPVLFVWLTAITEFIGGICLVLGLFTRLWAFLGAGMMFLIVLFIKGVYVDGAFNISARAGGFEYDLTLAIILSVVFILGAGGLSIDSKLKKTF